MKVYKKSLDPKYNIIIPFEMLQKIIFEYFENMDEQGLINICSDLIIKYNEIIGKKAGIKKSQFLKPIEKVFNTYEDKIKKKKVLKWFETTKKIKEEENKEIIKESNKQNKTVINKSNSVYLELNIEQSMNNNDLNKYIQQNYSQSNEQNKQNNMYTPNSFTDQNNLMAYSYLNSQLFPNQQNNYNNNNNQSVENLNNMNNLNNDHSTLNNYNSLNNFKTTESNSQSNNIHEKSVNSESYQGNQMTGQNSANLRGTEIFIGNLSIETEEADLRKLFAECGDVLDIRIHKSQTKKCYAFVRFLTKEQAKFALNKNGVVLNFRQIKVTKSNDNTTIFIGNIRKNWSNNDVEVKVRRIVSKF